MKAVATSNLLAIVAEFGSMSKTLSKVPVSLRALFGKTARREFRRLPGNGWSYLNRLSP